MFSHSLLIDMSVAIWNQYDYQITVHILLRIYILDTSTPPFFFSHWGAVTELTEIKRFYSTHEGCHMWVREPPQVDGTGEEASRLAGLGKVAVDCPRLPLQGARYGALLPPFLVQR